MLTHHSGRTLAVLLCLLVGLASLVVLGAAPPRNDPFHAPFVDNQPHSVAANSDTWLRFDYGSNGTTRTVVTLSLVNGAKSGVGFELFAPDIISDWWQEKPTGRGTIPSVDCSTGQVVGSSPCPSSDLMWSGAFGGAGTYYVRVINSNATTAPFWLVIQGEGVRAGPPIVNTPAAVIPVPVPSTPAPAPFPAGGPVFADDPFRAVSVDGVWRTIPGNSAAWYKFSYGGKEAGRPVVNLRLPGGVSTGVGFEVWDASKIRDFWEQKPIGRGTQEVVTNCTPAQAPTETVEEDEPTPTPEPAPGNHCATNDLIWSGAFGGAGTFYVRVVNPNPGSAGFVLLLY